MRLPGVPAMTATLLAVSVLAVLAARIPFGMTTKSHVTVADATEITRALRQSLETRQVATPSARLGSVDGETTALLVTAWENGRRRREWQIDGKPIGEALREAGTGVSRFGVGRDASAVRLQVDVVTAGGWMPQDGAIASLCLVPGRHGLSGVVGGRRVYLPPAELVRLGRYETIAPVLGYDAAAKLGVNLERARRSILAQAERLGVEGKEVTDLRRFDAVTVVEGADLVPRPLIRGTVARPEMSRAFLRASILAGAAYLERALGEDGLYRYHYDALADEDVPDKYNWPRHAGVSYSLALVGRLLDRPRSIDAAGRALDAFVKRLRPGPSGSRCLWDGGKCYVGSSALGLLALSEYRIASGDERFDWEARGVASFLLAMQKGDGLFHHNWYEDRGIDRETMKLYASQQAVLALARHARAIGDLRALAAAERGMDTLAGPYWDFFLGGYFFMQEHWTCLAAEEMHDAVGKKEYAEICRAIGDHYVRVTLGPEDTPYAEDVGGMSVTHLFAPHEGGTATAAEAMTSAVILGERVGLDVSRIRERVVQTYGFLAKCQVSAHDTFWTRRPEIALGGFFETQIRPRIRIDNVQHAISAMVRGIDLLPDRAESENASALSDFELPRASSGIFDSGAGIRKR